MAEYNNLKTLQGLSVGDVITYDTTTAIDFAGAKVKVELYGKTKTGSTLYQNAGLVEFVLDSSLTPESIFSFNKNNISGTSETQRYTRCDLIYGTSDSLYYRIAVAGNASDRYYYNGGYYAKSGIGGGSTGGGGGRTTTSIQNSTGGSQTSAGTGAKFTSGSSAKGTDGSFGAGGASNDTTYPSDGGYGWYGGGGGTKASTSSYEGGSGAGGSGFIIGVSTTTYPSSYLDGDTSLQASIASAISEGVLTQGGSAETTPKMVLTIIQSAFEPEGEIISISIGEKSAQKTRFIIGATFSYDGLEIIGTWGNGTMGVSDYLVSSPDMSKPGKKNVKVSYTYNGKTVSTSYTIEVLGISLKNIELNIGNNYGTFIGNRKLITSGGSSYTSASKGIYTYDLNNPSSEPLISFPNDTFFILKDQIYQYKEFVFAFKYTSSTSQSIVYSDDEGTTWHEGFSVAAKSSSSSTVNSSDYNSRFFEVNGNLFFLHGIASPYYIYKFDYQTKTWSQVFSGTQNYLSYKTPGIMSDGLHGVITIGSNSSSGYGYVIYTVDGGNTWKFSSSITGMGGYLWSDVISVKGNTSIIRFTKTSISSDSDVKYYKSTNGGQSYSSTSSNIRILDTTLPIIDNGSDYSPYIFINNDSVSSLIATVTRYNLIWLQRQTLRTSTNGTTWSPTTTSTYGVPKLVGKYEGKYIGIYKESETAPTKLTLSSNPVTNEDIEYIDLEGDAYYYVAKYSKETGSILLYDSSHNMQVIEFSSGESALSTSTIYYYTSSEFIPTNPYYYNGSEFVLCDAYRHNGTEFVKIE